MWVVCVELCGVRQCEALGGIVDSVLRTVHSIGVKWRRDKIRLDKIRLDKIRLDKIR